MTLARVRAVVVLLLLVGIALVSVVWAISSDGSDERAGPRPSCDPRSAAPTAPPEPKTVRVRVFNATDRPGLATTVKAALVRRGFTVVSVGNDNQVVEGTAQVRYGPGGAAGARLLRAYVSGAEAVADDRKDTVVDLVLGVGYTDLTPADQVAAELARISPEPVASHPCRAGR